MSSEFKEFHRISLNSIVHLNFFIRMPFYSPFFQKFFQSAASLEIQKATSWSYNIAQSADFIIALSNDFAFARLSTFRRQPGTGTWAVEPHRPAFGSWICHLLVVWPLTTCLNLLNFTSLISSFSYYSCITNYPNLVARNNKHLFSHAVSVS